jgi:hypothetical protein
MPPKNHLTKSLSENPGVPRRGQDHCRYWARRMMRKLITSIVISATLMGIFLGNAYLYCNVGYPSCLDRVGDVLLRVGIWLAIPPGMIWISLGNIGLVPELRGRESFIELNPGFWVFCFLFYVGLAYMGCGLWYWRKARWKTRKDAQQTSGGDSSTRADAGLGTPPK